MLSREKKEVNKKWEEVLIARTEKHPAVLNFDNIYTGKQFIKSSLFQPT